MKIKLSPVRCDEQLSASVVGDAITLNGIKFDFSQLSAGDTLPKSAVYCQWIASDVERIGDEIYLTLILPHGANAPHETRFPTAYSEFMTVTDGEVPLPPYNTIALESLE